MHSTLLRNTRPWLPAILLLYLITTGSTGPATAEANVPLNIPLPDTVYQSGQTSQDSLYHLYINKADQLYKAEKYTECLAELEKARSLKPNVPTLQERIIRVQGLIAQQKKQSEQYAAIIARADDYFSRKDYLNAKASYQMAIDVKPDDPYARNRLRETMELLRSLKAQNILYDVTVASADKLFGEKDYEKARKEYEHALQILPGEAYPREKVNQILKIQVDARVKEELYQTAIAEADRYFNSRSFQNALTEYRNALKQKPDESYPKQRIDHLTRIIDSLKLADESYRKIIGRADQLFAEARYSPARTEYEGALAVRPDDGYPAGRIREIDRILAGIARTNSEYEDVLTQADSLYIAKNFPEATRYYRQALKIKPEESYPKAMLAKTQAGISDQEERKGILDTLLARQKATDEKYARLMANADRLFSEQMYIQAKTQYQLALQVKPEESLPAEKIQSIDSVLRVMTEKQALAEQYRKLILSADSQFAKKEYLNARQTYTDARSLNPEDPYPDRQISRIVNILEDLSRKEALEKQYAASVKMGDSLFRLTNYTQAKEMFLAATNLKPSESYPKEKISEINRIQAEIEGKKQTYSRLVSQGDQYLAMKEFSRAKEEYLQASEIFPEEEYPREKVRFVTTCIDSIFRANKSEYDKAVGEGDGYFNSFEYDKAIDAYTRALSFLSSEEYPREMIAKIRKTIAENAIAEVLSQPVIIHAGEEKKFTFNPVSITSRRNNFIYLKVKNLSGVSFNILVRYGRDAKTSGGLAIRGIPAESGIQERLISVKDQDPWYREDNNWISLYPQGGDIEVSFIQVSRVIN
jgi:tetratricopeptide (TPR) repeat protein